MNPTHSLGLFAAYLAALATYEAQIAACHCALNLAEAREVADLRTDADAMTAYRAIDDVAPQKARVAYHTASYGKRSPQAEENYQAAFAKERALHRESRELWSEMSSDEEREEERALAWAERRAEGWR